MRVGVKLIVELFPGGHGGGEEEGYDKFHPDSHSAEWGDVIADGVGAFLALAAQLTIILTI